jgi:hypothetical protein
VGTTEPVAEAARLVVVAETSPESIMATLSAQMSVIADR